MQDYPIQVTNYCSEQNIEGWKDFLRWKRFLENSGHKITIRSKLEKCRSGQRECHAIFRQLSTIERREIEEGKYRLNKQGSIDLSDVPFDGEEKPKQKCTCVSCGKSFTRVKAVGRTLCSKCKYRSKGLQDIF
jgi:hypothetical protein